MTLPFDLARCTTRDCLWAASCARKEPGRTDGPQAVAEFSGRVDCHGYIERDNQSLQYTER